MTERFDPTRTYPDGTEFVVVAHSGEGRTIRQRFGDLAWALDALRDYRSRRSHRGWTAELRVSRVRVLGRSVP